MWVCGLINMTRHTQPSIPDTTNGTAIGLPIRPGGGAKQGQCRYSGLRMVERKWHDHQKVAYMDPHLKDVLGSVPSTLYIVYYGVFGNAGTCPPYHQQGSITNALSVLAPCSGLDPRPSMYGIVMCMIVMLHPYIYNL